MPLIKSLEAKRIKSLEAERNQIRNPITHPIVPVWAQRWRVRHRN